MSFIICLLTIGQGILAGSNEIQQQGAVTVTVQDANGTLVGATEVVKGTTQGELTNNEGVVKFNNLSPDDVLVVSYVGYITEEINVSGRASIDVLFTEDVHAIDELVVFGYGTQKKTGFI